VLEQVKHKLSLEIEDVGPQEVKNIADPIQVYRVALESAEGLSESASPTDEMFFKPAVAVLPFENLSGDPDQEFFADGLTEDIITALSLWRSFPVIARNSTFAYKGQSPDIRKAGAELGARYVIEGSVRKAGERVRVTAQLINAENGHHIWAEKFDRNLDDIFELQDELSQLIVGTVAPEVLFSKLPEARENRSQNLDARELVQRGYADVVDLDPQSIASAREYFEQAIEIEPHYARAHAGLALTYHREIWLGFSEFAGESKERFMAAAQRATSLDEHDSECHAILAMAYYWAGEYDRGIAEASRAIDLNPNNAQARELVGTGLNFSGRPTEGIPHQKRAHALSPRDPRQGYWMWTLAVGYLMNHEFETAVECTERAIQRHTNNPDAHLVQASSLGHLGRVDDARATFETYREMMPEGSVRLELIWRFKNESDTEHYLEGLRKAGLVT
jgi:adenylate cyclase